MPSSPVSPRDLGLKEKKFQSIEDSEAAYNIMVRRLNETYKYNRRDHDRLTEDVGDVGGGTLGLFSNVEHHTSDDTLLASETGSCHTNAGASADIALTLPDNAANGTFFFFSCITAPGYAYKIFIHPSGNNGIYWSGFTDAPGPDGYWISTGQRGMAVGLVADDNGDWVVFTVNGAWSSQ